LAVKSVSAALLAAYSATTIGPVTSSGSVSTALV
jgi:hypothetical protein